MIQRSRYVLALIVISGILLIPLWSTQFYVSHDGQVLVARFAAYFKSFADGVFIPRFADDLNFKFGSPVFNFYYPLPGYIASFLHIFSISFENCFKIIMSIGYIAGPVTFFLWLNGKVKSEVAFIGGLMYGCLPYHFINIYVRGDVGEMLALGIVPLCFYFLDKCSKKNNFYAGIGFALSYGLVVLSHNGVSLMFSGALALYILIDSLSIRERIRKSAYMIFGLLLSCFFWFPALYEQRFVNGSILVGNMYKDHFLTVREIVFSQWGFGPNVNEIGGQAPQLGIIITVSIVLAIGILIFNKIHSLKIIYWLFIGVICLFLLTNYSDIIWGNIPLLKAYQFPWRLLGLAGFSLVAFSALSFDLLPKKVKERKGIFLGFAFVLLLSVFGYTRIKPDIARPDSFYSNFPYPTYFHGEASSIWAAGDPTAYAQSHGEVIAGEATISKYQRNIGKRIYTVSALTPAVIKENILYYPGWNVYVDNKKTAIQFQDQNHRGFITYPISKGIHNVTILFQETRIRLVADCISLLSLVIIGLVLIYKGVKKYE